MPFRAGRRFVVLLCACLVCGCLPTACGGGTDTGEVVLGSETGKSQVERNRARIRELEDRLAHRERRASRDAPRPSPDSGLLASDADLAFDALAESLGGDIGAAVGPVGSGPARQFGTLRSGSAWSTIKVPMAARLIEDAGGPDALSSATRDAIAKAITASDNAAAAALWEELGDRHGGPAGAAAAIDHLLRAAGDGQTEVSTVGRDGFSPYGQTEWSLDAQERFMSRLAAGCVAPAAAGELRSLMGQVAPDQRWGLGSTNAQAYFKGGWGPGADGRYLVRQVGVLERGDRRVAVAIAAIPADGQFATGTQAITQIARWVVANVNWRVAAPYPC